MLGAWSEVDICNAALSHLGVSQGIQSINPPDQSANATACAFWYPKARDSLVQSAPWDFGCVSLALAGDPTVFPGYTYAYQMPIDCLQPIAVVTAYGQRNFPSNLYNLGRFGFPGAANLPKIPYKIVQSVNAGMRAILCDILQPYLIYITQVTDTGLFTPMFSTTLSYGVASKIGGTLRTDANKVKEAMQAYNQMRLEAIAQAMNAQQQDAERDAGSVLARW